MAKKFKSMLGGVESCAALGVCVLAIAVGGYFLLFGGEKQAETPQIETPAPVEEPVTPTQPVVETVLPTPVEVETPPAPAEAPEEDVPVVAEAPRLVVSPLKGEVVAAFSVDELQYSETLADWRTHDGMDISASAGTTVMAASAGTVLAVTDDALMGTTVTIEHSGGYQTTYANLQAKPAVSQGDTVSAGQIIGAVGTTAAAESAQGPHLHFSVTQDGDAVDPNSFLKQ